MQILETKDLILRNTNLDDIDELYKKIFSDKDVVKYTFGSDLFTYEQTENFIKQNCNFDEEVGLSTLIKKDTKEIVGLAGLMSCNLLEKDDYEFGFILAKKFWGKGYATQIGQAQINMAKDELKLPRVLALADKQNIGSLATIKKLGLKRVCEVNTSKGKREVYSLEF